MNKLFNLLLWMISIILLLVLIFASFQKVYFLMKHYKHDDISKGVIIDLKARYMKGGGSYLYYIIQGEDKNIYQHNDKIVPSLEVGDKVTFRYLHNSNSVLILTSNNIKINVYYYIVDYFLTLFALLTLFIIFYYIKRKINDKRY